MKIVVAQFWTKNLSYARYTKEINKKYCDQNNYIYFVEENESKIRNRIGNKAMTWYKPFLISDVFETLNPDYVLFLDADAIVVDHLNKIENFIIGGKEIVVTEDYGPSAMNAGVILIKNSEWSKNFLKQWYSTSDELEGGTPPRKGYYANALWHDQTGFSHLLRNDSDVSKNISVIDNKILNGRYFKDPNNQNFIFHAFSYGQYPNRTIDLAYHTLFNIPIPEGENLLDIIQFYPTDKHYEHNYFRLVYNDLFKPIKDTCNKFMEIGILECESLKLWRDYFLNSEIIGVDIDLNPCLNKLKESSSERISLLKYDQSNSDDLTDLSNLYTDIDVILEDGSHMMQDQQITLAKLFKCVKPGGIYILEDLHTSIELLTKPNHWISWGDRNKTITLEMLENFIDRGIIESDYMTQDEMDYLTSHIESIEIYRNSPNWSVTGIIKKKTI